jgi:exosortase
MRHGIFLTLVAAGVVLYGGPLTELAALSSGSELHQHIPLIPLVSGYFLLMSRREISLAMVWSPKWGAAVTAAGGLFCLLVGIFGSGLIRNDYLSAMMLGLVIWTAGSFVLAYGVKALKAGLFPMLFLAFIIPVPGFILGPSVTFLQVASAGAAELVLRISGVPFLREGMIFSLPGIDVEVAEQCSGIRSSLALVITAIIAGKLFLQNGSAKVALVLAVLPVTIFKNGLRIVTLSLLASYVDPVFITGHWLHRSGGIPFFMVGLILLAPVLWILRRVEVREIPARKSSPNQGSPKAQRMAGRIFQCLLHSQTKAGPD